MSFPLVEDLTEHAIELFSVTEYHKPDGYPVPFYMRDAALRVVSRLHLSKSTAMTYILAWHERGLEFDLSGSSSYTFPTAVEVVRELFVSAICEKLRMCEDLAEIEGRRFRQSLPI